MRNLFIACLVAAALQTAIAQTDVRGTWTAELHTGRVFIQVNTAPPPDWNRSGDWNGGWNMGQTYDVTDVSGLPGNDDRLTAAAVKFEMRREAGTLGFEGQFRDGRGAGLFTFVPREAFVNEMRAIGFKDDLPLWRRYQLAVHDVGPKYVGQLKAEGFANLTLDQIQRAKTHGVTIENIKAMKQAGFSGASFDDLVRAKDHGVTPEYVKEMKDLGLAAPDLAGYVRTKDHGVTAAYARELSAQGFKNVPLDDLVRAKDHGVSADYIADMKEIFKTVTLAQLVRLRDHGVTPGFVNHARARGFTTTDPDEMIRLKNTNLRDSRDR